MDCASSLVKYLMFLFNLIFAISGLALVVVGVLYHLRVGEVTGALENSPIGSAPILVVVLGAIVFLIAFFGCCGAIRESSCMLTTYAVTLLLIFILQLALGIFIYLQIKNEDDFRNLLRKDLKSTFDKYNTVKEARESVDLLQSTVQCCGVDGVLEWGLNVPNSCCAEKTACSALSPSLYRQGCSGKVFDLMKENIKTIGIAALALSATELLAAIFGLCLSSNIKKDRRHY